MRENYARMSLFPCIEIFSFLIIVTHVGYIANFLSKIRVSQSIHWCGQNTLLGWFEIFVQILSAVTNSNKNFFLIQVTRYFKTIRSSCHKTSFMPKQKNTGPFIMKWIPYTSSSCTSAHLFLVKWERGFIRARFEETWGDLTFRRPSTRRHHLFVLSCFFVSLAGSLHPIPHK